MTDTLSRPAPQHTQHCLKRQKYGDGECECMRPAPQQEQAARFALAPHCAQYDRLGWICSVCNGWNHVRDKVCRHVHASPPKEAK